MPTMKLNHLNVYVSDRTQLMTHKPKVVSNAALHPHDRGCTSFTDRHYKTHQ